MYSKSRRCVFNTFVNYPVKPLTCKYMAKEILVAEFIYWQPFSRKLIDCSSLFANRFLKVYTTIKLLKTCSTGYTCHQHSN